METTLLFGDFFWIAIIVIFFGGGSSYVTKNSYDNKKLDQIISQLDRLEGKDQPEQVSWYNLPFRYFIFQAMEEKGVDVKTECAVILV